MKHLDKVAMVTGASMGIGKAMCRALATEGCHVVCAARSTAKLEATANEVRALGRRALAVTTDVTDPAAVQRLVDATMAEFGKIDILVNNAGGPLAGVSYTPPTTQNQFFDLMNDLTFANISDQNWRGIFAANFDSALNCIRAVLPIMIQQDSGRIINVSSKAGKIKCDVVPGMIAYASAKAALSRFTEVLAFELTCLGSEVKVFALSPGMIATAVHAGLPTEELEAFGRPEDVMPGFLALLDDACVASGETFTAETGKTWYDEIREGDNEIT